MEKVTVLLLSMPSGSTLFWMGVAGIAAWLLFAWLHREDGLTKSAMFWANVQEPLIFKSQTPFDTHPYEAYDEAVAMLKKHGNQHLDPSKHVYLWPYGKEEEKMNVDWAEWSFQAVALEKRIREEFRKEKLKQAASANGGSAAGSAEGAKYFAGVKPEEFDDIREQ